MNYLIVSEKKWNYSSLLELKKTFPNDHWVYAEKKTEFTYEKVKQIEPEYIFIIHWSYIIQENIFKNYKCILFHMTDLPFGRGGSPLQNLIAGGIYKTKISAIAVEKKLDAGKVYLKADLDLLGSAEEIFMRADNEIYKMIKKLIKSKIKPVPQKGNPTFFKRRTPEMSNIESIDSLIKLYDHIRMLDAEGYPHAYFENKFFRFEFTRSTMKTDKIIIADVRITPK
jgi:methionyl-tRNA formyltransferase